MAGKGISFDSDRLNNLSKRVEDEANQYAAHVRRLYSTVDQLSSSWAGKDSQSYITKVNSYKSDIQKLGEVINDYSEFLRSTSKYMSEVNSSIADSANRLL